MGRLKMQDWNLVDQTAGLENAGLENTGPENAALENAGPENAGQTVFYFLPLTPLASVNCKGRAFRGGYLFCCCCCCALLYDTLRHTGVD